MPRTIRQHSMIIALALGLSAVLWYSGEIGRWLLAFGVLLIVPGWWWQRLWPLTQAHWVERWMLQACIGPAMVVIIYLWAAWLDVRLPVTALWLGLAGLTVLMLWRMPVWQWPHGRIPLWWPTIILVVLVLVGVTRWLHIDGLVLPPWVDGVHHALLVRVAIEQGHAAWNLMPYLPVDPLLYHTGWHSVMAFVWSISPSDLIGIGWFLLIIGQCLNVLAVVSVTALAWVWCRSWPATVIAAVIVGLWSIMPAYYLSWGRYTLLAGMVWLPVALVAIEMLWHDEAFMRWPWIGVLIAGLLLTHFVVGVIAIIWGVVLWGAHGRLPQRWMIVIGLVLLCMLPWWSIFVGQAVWTNSGDASARAVVGNASHNAFVPELFWARHHAWLVPLTLLSAWWLVRHRQIRGALVVIWWALVMMVANPLVIGLPYLSFFTNETWLTALYIPIGLLIAGGGARWHHRWMSVVLVAIALVGFGGMQRVVRSATILTNQADTAAIAWIDAKLPADAVLLTNATDWMWQVDRGVDGGWWVLPLTGRATTTPPVLFTYADGPVAQAFYAQTSQVRQIGTADALAAWLQKNPAITHIYATERGAITPQIVGALPNVTNVYATGDVVIYAVEP